MSAALASAGWSAALVLAVVVLRLRRRLELAAQACHELRGPATAIGLAAACLRREPGGARRAMPLEAQLDRLRAGLDDLELARAGCRAPSTPATIAAERLLRRSAAGWRPVAQAQERALNTRVGALGEALVRADHGRLAQALGNLLANAFEHGSGTVELTGRESGGRVILEVRDEGGAHGACERPGRREPGRGRGLGVAARAVEEAGGTLTVVRGDRGTVAALELPAAGR